ncbi:hypothetical protein PL321_18920 [Caloramator sp. mosi_1]|uniref:hypothetical protein n=1 Tax=Caloramator sp. mosi_1 TaxID=3023090 RepID=UPI002361DF4C|nr:hypothetical protein [Caloramator sp. mosi_1]WDC84256.1 hypothetical protein PL321_18920 [Caloramator sp. mosi_1]
MDYRLNGVIMGSEVTAKDENIIDINVKGSSAIDRIEIIRNGVVEDTYVHNGKWEDKKLEGLITFKFELELGWGPDRRIFDDIREKIWKVSLETKGKILNIEKLWTSPGSIIKNRAKIGLMQKY